MAREFAFIDWVRRQSTGDGVTIGPGDDCAALEFSGELLVTKDVLMEGRHFLSGEVGPRAAGRKAMAVNLSDIAAMAGRPIAAVIGVALPADSSDEFARELFLGMKDVADRFNTKIVGGDTNVWDGPLVLSVTLLGQATGRGPVTRSGARPGDWLFVTGPLGGSILGKHLDFTPRVAEAIGLHAEFELHAMIDLSDGLAGDLRHVCAMSGCGAVIDAAAVPISDAAVRLSGRDGVPPLTHALSDGEDFELLTAVPPDVGRAWGSRLGVTKVGECVSEGVWLDTPGGRVEMAQRGFEH